MKVIVKGSPNIEALAKKLIEVVDNTVEMLERDNPDVAVQDYVVLDAEVSFGLKMKGMEEPQAVMVNHGMGNEVFTWVVGEDEEPQTNKDESLFDQAQQALMTGQNIIFDEIESEYDEADLEYIEGSMELYGDMSKEMHLHADGFKVLRVYQFHKLIQEIKLTEKE